MNRVSALIVLVAVVLGATGCDQEKTMSERGFRLPEGDPAAGRDAFLYMQCHECHTLEGEQFPPIPDQVPPYVALGGDVSRVKTYGELVTAIINPSHRLASGYPREQIAEGDESRMYVYNRFMTVQELIDIVTYLQPFYDVVPPEFRYPVYPM